MRPEGGRWGARVKQIVKKEAEEQSRTKICMEKLKREERREMKAPGIRWVVPEGLGNHEVSARKQHQEKQVQLNKKVKARIRNGLLGCQSTSCWDKKRLE